jgi:hypothetical protein
MTMLSILHPPALQTPAPWWETSQLWVSVGVLLLLGTVAILLWQGLVRLRAMEGHLTRLDLLEKVDGTLGRLVEGQAGLDLRRVEHLLTDIRDGQTRLEDVLARAAAAPGEGRGEPGGSPAGSAAALADRIVNRLLAQGYERVRLLVPVADLAPLVSGSDGEGNGEVPLEARRHGSLVKGRAVIRGGVIEEVSIQESYGAFP